MHAKLEAQDIRLEYFQPRTNTRLLALDGVDLTIMDGEFVSIVGPSGCGKTTFLSLVDGLIAASAGRILVDGRAVTKPGRIARSCSRTLRCCRGGPCSTMSAMDWNASTSERARRRSVRPTSSRWLAFPVSSITIPTSCRAACSSA